MRDAAQVQNKIKNMREYNALKARKDLNGRGSKPGLFDALHRVLGDRPTPQSVAVVPQSYLPHQERPFESNRRQPNTIISEDRPTSDSGRPQFFPKHTKTGADLRILRRGFQGRNSSECTCVCVWGGQGPRKCKSVGIFILTSKTKWGVKPPKRPPPPPICHYNIMLSYRP